MLTLPPFFYGISEALSLIEMWIFTLVIVAIWNQRNLMVFEMTKKRSFVPIHWAWELVEQMDKHA